MTARLLIVDDNEDIRWMLRLMFQNADCHVAAEASDGFEALEKVAELAPDLVVMDVAMPEMDGVETTRLIRERYPSVRIVGFTAAGPERVRAIRHAGAEAVFSKDGFIAVIDHVRGWSAA